MRVYRSLLLGILILGLMISGCAQQPEEVATSVPEEAGETALAPTEAVPEAAEIKEITVWETKNGDADEIWFNDYADRLMDEHPNIRINVEFFPTNEYRPKIYAALAAGSEPDIFELPVGEVGWKSFDDGNILPLDDLLEVDKFTDWSIRFCSYGEHTICMPTWAAIHMFYYNTEIFNKAGIDRQNWADPQVPTWEEFTQAIEAIIDAGYVPLGTPCGDGWPCAQYFWILQNRYGGVDELEEGLVKPYATLPGFQKAAEMIAWLGQQPWHPEGYLGVSGGQKYTLFTESIAAMTWMGTFVLPRLEDAPEDFSYDIFNFPSLPDGDPNSQHDVLGGISAQYVSANTKHPDVVAIWMNGFAETENAVDYTYKTRFIPVVKSAVDEVKKGEDPFLSKNLTILDEAPRVAPWWDHATPTAVFEGCNANIALLYAGDITPEEFLATLDELAGR
jgi:ABC-type glycerol-3-phosphate transport system substrate-binding protein